MCIPILSLYLIVCMDIRILLGNNKKTFSLNFFTLPGCSLFISLQRTTPSFKTSPKSPVGIVSPKTDWTHFQYRKTKISISMVCCEQVSLLLLTCNTSFSWSGLRLDIVFKVSWELYLVKDYQLHLLFINAHLINHNNAKLITVLTNLDSRYIFIIPHNMV